MKVDEKTNRKINHKINSKAKPKQTGKITAAIAMTSCLFLTPNIYAVDPDPCGAELCLPGIGLAGGIQDCKVHIKKFFSISATGKHGIFLPGVTYAKRYKWLNQCKSGNAAFKALIMNTYGNLPSSPF